MEKIEINGIEYTVCCNATAEALISIAKFNPSANDYNTLRCLCFRHIDQEYQSEQAALIAIDDFFAIAGDLSNKALQEWFVNFGFNQILERRKTYFNEPGSFIPLNILKKRFQGNFDKMFSPQPIVKQNPKQNENLIIFKDSGTIEKLHSELKGYFRDKEAELLSVLQGEQLTELLLFPHSQNKFVEVFRRLKYNGFLLNTDTETKNWICTTFQFVKKGIAEPQPFNESSVWDILNKGRGEPTKKERICNVEWLPYKSPLQLKRETENEKR